MRICHCHSVIMHALYIFTFPKINQENPVNATIIKCTGLSLGKIQAVKMKRTSEI
jgi:hypothetical protein